jgi:2-polyprenyl-3-methyl-5-hydroxy-6-metoxy-1,4-benzoquinol methylase
MAPTTQSRNCPACGSSDVTTIECLNSSEIVRLYRRAAQLDVSRFFERTPEVRLERCTACDLQFYVPPCPGDGPFYEQLQQFDWYYQEDKPEYELVRKYASEGDAVLEVGCGSGAFRSWLPDSVDYVGLEINEEAVRAGTARGLRVLKQPIEEHVTATSRRYDLVCAFQVLEHIPNPASFVEACVKALSPRGKLVFAVPAQDGFMGFGANLFLNLPPHHALRWSDRALRALASRQGLEVVDVWHEPVAPYHRELHTNVLARYYFALLGLKRMRLIENRWSDRMLRALMRIKPLRNACAARALARGPNMNYGHTVALIATPRGSAADARSAGEEH